VNVNSANDAPQGASATVTTNEDTGFVFGAVNFTLSDPNDTPANVLAGVKITTLPTAGTLTNNGTAVTAGQVVTVGDITGGKLIFTPAANASGTNYASFTFQVQDDGGTANGGANLDPTARTMTVNVTSVNDAPQGAAATVTTNEDIGYVFGAVNFTLSDPNDTPANTLAGVKITTLPTVGTLTNNGTAVTAGQVITVGDITGGKLIFTPAANASGTNYASFTFQVQDNGGTANGGANLDPTARAMTVNVTPVNDAPQGTAATVTTNEDTGFVFGAGNFAFSDPNDTPANTLAGVKITTLPTVGTLTNNGTAVTAGQVVTVGDITGGKLIFTPAANASGTNYASFTFQVQDDGGTANGGANLDPTSRSMTVNVTAVSDAPQGTAATVTTNEDTAYTFTVANFGFTDPNDSGANTLLAVKITTVPAVGSLTNNGTAVTAGQTIAVGDITGGKLVFAPVLNGNGLPYASFTFQVQDNGGTANGGADLDPTARLMTIHVNPVNDPPTMSTIGTLGGAHQDTAYTITYAALLAASDAADVDVGDVIRFRIEGVSSGTLSKGGVAVTPGTTTLGPTESLVWTPPAGINGTLEAFTAVAWDGLAASSPAVAVNVSVTGVNHEPTLTTIQTLTGAIEDTDFEITYAALLTASNANDADGDTINFRVEAVSSGTLTKGGSPVTAGTLLGPGESLIWRGDANANGLQNAFTTSAWDGIAASAAPVQVKVDVTPVNDAPTLSSFATLSPATEDTDFTITYAALRGASDAADVDGDAISFRVESVAGGTLTKGGVPVTVGVTTLSAGESLVWRGDANANGTLEAFTAVAVDGSLASAAAVPVKVDVAAVNDTPTLTTIDTFAGGVEDTDYTISYADLLAASDAADVDGDPISFRVEAVSSGTLTKGGVPVTAGSTTLSAGESLVWHPAANANGVLDAFTVAAWDGVTASPAVQVTVDVASENDSPTVSTIDTLTGATEDADFTITYAALLAASDAVDVDGDAISFQVQAVSTGTLTKNGVPVTAGVTTLEPGESLVWHPAAGAAGVLDAFTVTASDGTASSGSAVQVRVDVTAVNDGPTLTNIDTLTGAAEDAEFTISYSDLLAASDAADQDGDPISFRVDAVSSGTLTKDGVPVTAGVTLVGPGESLVWRGAADANGVLGAFSAVAWDGVEASTPAVLVSVNVAEQNDDPTRLAGSVADLTVAAGAGLTTMGLSGLDYGPGGGADEAGQTLTYAVTSVPASSLGSVVLADGTTVVAPGAYTLDEIRGMQFLPSAGSAGGTGTFAFTVTDDGTIPGGADPQTLTESLSITVEAAAGQADTIGLFDPTGSTFYLREANTTGMADYTFGYGEPGANWIVLKGDWDGNGGTDVGLYDPEHSVFYLTDTYETGMAHYTFGFGNPGEGWIPVAGDWDGDGRTSVGLYDPQASVFYLTDDLTTGFAKYTVGFGDPTKTYVPLVGDWNGDGHSGIGLFEPATSYFFLTNTLATGVAEHLFGYGEPGKGWLPMVGDWNADRTDGVGLYDPAGSTFYLTNAFVSGYAEYTFGYGEGGKGWMPIVGDWNGDGGTGVGLYAPGSSTFYLTDRLSAGYAEYTAGFGQPGANWLPVVGHWEGGDSTSAVATKSSSESAATLNASAVDQLDLGTLASEAALDEEELVYGPQKPDSLAARDQAFRSL
jgi:hypothetical protein